MLLAVSLLSAAWCSGRDRSTGQPRRGRPLEALVTQAVKAPPLGRRAKRLTSHLRTW